MKWEKLISKKMAMTIALVVAEILILTIDKTTGVSIDPKLKMEIAALVAGVIMIYLKIQGDIDKK